MKITVRLANEPDSDGHYGARVYTEDGYNRTFFNTSRDAALTDATEYARWLRDHDPSEEVIEL